MGIHESFQALTKMLLLRILEFVAKNKDKVEFCIQQQRFKEVFYAITPT